MPARRAAPKAHKDTGTMNTVTISRYEYKYLLLPERVPEVRRFVLQYCSPDANAQGAAWYDVQSLYLDTPDCRFYRESVEKAVRRMKLRVRAYASQSGPVKLEVKCRTGDVVDKESLLLDREAWDRAAGGGAAALYSIEAVKSSRFLHLVGTLRAEPKALVVYERQAFYSDVDDYVRVTFDRHMRGRLTHDWTTQAGGRAWCSLDAPSSADERESPYVLELKFQVRPPAWLRDLVVTFGLTRRGFSKYARAVRRTVTANDPAWDLRPLAGVSSWAWRIA
jgi:hypothetical protein